MQAMSKTWWATAMAATAVVAGGLGLQACSKGGEKSEGTAAVSAVASVTASASGSAAPKEASLEELIKASKALSPQPKEQKAGAATIHADLCKLEGAPFLGKSSSTLLRSVAVVGNKLVVADEKGALHGYSIDKTGGCKLTVDQGFGTDGVLKLPRDINYLSSDDTGRILASNGIFSAYAVKDGKQEFECKTSGNLEPTATGKWAIGPWVNATVKLVDVGPSGCTGQEWVLKDLGNDAKRQGAFKNVNTSAVIGDLILIAGVPVEKVNGREPRIVVAYDKAGKEKFRFGNTATTTGPDTFGWIHALSACRAGICALDSNYKRISLWKSGGGFVASVELGPLFDMKSPWIQDFAVAKDGTAYFVTAQAREGSPVVEGNIYAVRGL